MALRVEGLRDQLDRGGKVWRRGSRGLGRNLATGLSNNMSGKNGIERKV